MEGGRCGQRGSVCVRKRRGWKEEGRPSNGWQIRGNNNWSVYVCVCVLKTVASHRNLKEVVDMAKQREV